MGTWSPARVVAPLALIACLISVVVVVQAARPKGDGGATVAAPARDARPGRAARRRPRFYVVKAGDNLTLIAERTGVPLEALERANPGVDAQALTVGQRLRLPR